MTMPESVIQSEAWRPLTVNRGPADTLLAVDFDATGRQEARFSDLLAGLGGGLIVLETVPSPSVITAADQVEHWIRPHEQARTQVRAVLGYCAGAVYAAALAERIVDWQPFPPALLLFDPEIPEPQTLLWQFYKVTGIIASVLSEQEAAAARHSAQQAYEASADLETLCQKLIALVRQVGDPALARTGLDQARREELFIVFNTFLRFLALSSQIDPLDQWRHAVAFSSTSPLNGLRVMRANGRVVEVAREIDIDVDHAGLLADQKVAAIVGRMLKDQALDVQAEARK
jgi:hypothetical protein